MKILVNGIPFEMPDCTEVRLADGIPSCALGLDMAGCGTCASRKPRPTAARPPTIVQRAVSWAKAEASAIVSSIADEEYALRIAACKSCDSLEPRPDPQVGFCKSCGCGNNPRAELTVKGKMPAAKCPLSKWPARP